MERKIIIAGGGTGGHIFPAIAIANAMVKAEPATQILFVGAKGKMEMEKVPQAGYKIKGIDIAGYNRSSLIKNISLPLKLVKSFIQVKNIIKSFKPDAVIGVGGYSSFPVFRYAQVKGIPTFIHESNSFAGKSNIYLGKKATGIFVATSGMERFFPQGKIFITGNPVRPSIAESSMISKREAMDYLELTGGKKVLLIIGGSLGAKSINEAIENGLELLVKNNIDVIWQTGKPFFEKAKQKAVGIPGVQVRDFITRMELAYAAADVIVSRAGAMAIAEISLVKKPVIFVPYPYAAEDHQTANAKKLADENAAVIIKDSETKTRLVPAILDLFTDEQKQNVLKQNIARHGVKNADEIIAKEIFKRIIN